MSTESKTPASTAKKKEKKTELAPVGKATKEQLKKWEDEYGEVFCITVDGPDNKRHHGYLFKPDRAVFAQAMSLFAQHMVVEAGGIFIDELWLGGSELMKDGSDLDNWVYTAACMAAMNTIELPNSSVKKT